MERENDGQKPADEAPKETPNEGAPKETPKGAPSVDDLTRERDEWKTHARTWEDRAKANKDAADKLAEAEQALADATEKLSEAAEKAATADVLKLVVKHGLAEDDVAILVAVTDEEQRSALAERLAAASSRVPRPDNLQGNGSEAPPLTPRDEFVAMFNS